MIKRIRPPTHPPPSIPFCASSRTLSTGLWCASPHPIGSPLCPERRTGSHRRGRDPTAWPSWLRSWPTLWRRRSPCLWPPSEGGLLPLILFKVCFCIGFSVKIGSFSFNFGRNGLIIGFICTIWSLGSGCESVCFFLPKKIYFFNEEIKVHLGVGFIWFSWNWWK